MTRRLLRLHRTLSLAVAVLWGLQAATGLVLVFRVEIDNALTPGASASLDAGALGAALPRLPGEIGAPVASFTVADRAGGRFDVFTAEDRRVARISGRGDLIAVGRGLEIANRLDDLKSFHESLWLSDAGTALLGVSALLLLSNIGLGLTLAWPRAGGARRALIPPPAAGAARTFQTHRALGLWFAIPALVLVLAGAAMALGDPLSDRLGAGRPPPQATSSPRPFAVPLRAAADLALRRYPGARVSVINLPAEDSPWFRFRLRQTGELQRFYGATEVFVDARSGTVLAYYDGRRAPQPRALFDTFYPVHTLEFLGPVGRLIAAGVGVWLLTMVFLGLRLWRARRRANA